MTFTEFMRREIGSNWVIARRTKNIVRGYGEDVVTLSHKQYKELELKWKIETADEHPACKILDLFILTDVPLSGAGIVCILLRAGFEIERRL